MITGKQFEKVAWTVTAVMLAITILFMNGKSLGIETVTPVLGYETRLFDNTRVHTIDIVMDDWDTFIANATSEEYAAAAVVIDGEAFRNVGIRGKGNTSLSNVSSMGSQRYSLKIEFDQYDSTKTYYGLDKLALNNMIQDSTMMKDYLTYTMMKEFGVSTPLCSFVYVTVNGEDWGLYLAVEGVEDGFLERNYGANAGKLYKPDSMSFGGGRGNGQNFRMSDFWNENFASDEDSDGTGESTETTPAMSFPSFEGGFDSGAFPGDFPGDMTSSMPSMPSAPGMPDFGAAPENFDPSSVPDGFEAGKGGGFGGFGGFGGIGSSDVKLQYIDDELDSYSNIWNNAKTDISKADQRRLIASLKKLSSNEDIESVVDVEQVIRYFVVHNYVCNGDSYTGAMIHNYYLYEKGGQMAMIPWDYNLAFGTFQGGDAAGTVNTPIDSPVSGSMEDRPMLNWIFANEEYTELYHRYFAEFLETVDIIGIIDSAYELIAPYVEKDPTAFYTYDEFEQGVLTLRTFCEMRTESIEKQLETGETVNEMDYVDASALNLSDMGSMGGRQGGGDHGDHGSGHGSSRPSAPDGMPSDAAPAAADPEQGAADAEGTIPAIPTEGRSDASGAFPSVSAPGIPAGSESDSGEHHHAEMTPPGNMSFGMPGESAGVNKKTAGVWLGVSALLLIAGLFTAKKYRIW